MKISKSTRNLSIVVIFFFCLLYGCSQKGPKAYQEENGVAAVEAENFYEQTMDDVRKWHIIAENDTHNPDHTTSASGEKYIEVLPDTRVTHDDKLIHGENFSNDPGKMALISYWVHFKNPGKYYVWVRAYSTGAEDNGIHVGINDTWPESGRRLQWSEGKNAWTWESKQRTTEVHTGVERLIYLEVPETGVHKITFSMREDGFEMDKWVMSKEYVRPEGEGPRESLLSKIKPPKS